MKLNPNLKPIISSLFSLALLSIQNPAIASVNQGKLGNSSINLGLNITKEFTKKQPIQIAENDEFWGPQGDFQILMPGDEVENNKKLRVTENKATETVYMIFHGDLPTDVDYLNSEGIREVLQTSLRQNLDIKGKVVKSTNMVIEGYPGIELLVQHSDGSLGQYQGYVVKRRLYLIGARAKDELTTEAINFFDSFRVYPTKIVN
ncbi:hypothetical protein [Anabaena sp. AL93]|jgi:hypothetical protein|uniref:hypothetical protein n=1 Tax=Anabaena sp. AL93 TaxID=1678133 RepID=UPI0007FCA517|nr:hypothetical protein [Anabaena sp. AL93]OBQ18465.1 MAG: hypothetical protein AN486_11975 [Anabaena sp. AL93]